MLLIIIAAILFSILTWLLVAPLFITINTTKGVYEIHWKTIGKASLNIIDESLAIRFRVFFFKGSKSINLFKKKKTKKVKTRRAKKKGDNSKMFRRFKRVMASFKILIFRIDLDTDNYYYNAFLYPICHFINYRKFKVNINFSGENDFHIKLKNRPINILIALVRKMR